LPDEFLETIYKSISEHPIMPFDDSPEGKSTHTTISQKLEKEESVSQTEHDVSMSRSG
jgi:Sec7-like guanine-nucleotide exchange factor